MASVKINLKPVSVIKSDLGIQEGGPVHNYFTGLCEKAMDKYVPMGSTGNLSATVTHTTDEIIYSVPYAHYMYEGRVMGPNIPVFDKNGNIVRWWSKGPKYYTGKDIEYNTDRHPLATSHWAEKMWSAEKEDIEKELQYFMNRGNK